MTSTDPVPPGPTPPGPGSGKKPRTPRADAQRNRDKLVRVAGAAFASADGTVSLEGIARDAGVGIGTLYRHFPTREALVEAVYAAELDDVAASAPALLRELPPDAALRAWIERYAAFIATKRGMADTLRAGWASGRIATSATRERITAAIATILTAGAEAGTGADAGALRADVEPDDVTVMLLGIFLAGAAAHTSEQTGRLIDLVMDALRPPPPR
ncbi:TetR/AcrR family transcriptional regulator [Streptomyces sp. ITFR-6]|uniref:TetR/AcrR family transcriptional regulator n=1 Tax=Streptomyces sp. ITFR-6 TaxID=3075197 RepID=UPI0028892C29|nr:TetR/AcrR family transcriptional regulator [Streptomyces sp. ITFR-6]WNI30091.1 TetR/AcrR family transcriptional regulator [Streptomyces sp. ITFR-6]